MPDRRTQLAIKEPLFIVLGTVEIKEIFQYLGGSHELGIKLFSKTVRRQRITGQISAALQIIGGKQLDFLAE
jgi:hypothetical protein